MPRNYRISKDCEVICVSKNMAVGVLIIACAVIFICCGGPEKVSAQEYEIRYSFLEPLDGMVYYPGNKIYLSLYLRDLNERVKSVAFYITPPNSKKPREPFYMASDGKWFTTWVVPEDAQEGWYRISAQAFDKNGVRKGNETTIALSIKNPQVHLSVSSPSNGQKFIGGQDVNVTGVVNDRANVVKRVDFFIYRASSELPAAPSYTDKKLSGGCSAKIRIPASPLDEYTIVLRAFDSLTGGRQLAEAKVGIKLVAPEIRLRIIEPRGGSAFYPGQKIHVLGEVRDSGRNARKVSLSLAASKKEKPEEPFAGSPIASGGFTGEYLVPYELAYGTYVIIAEAKGDDDKGPALAREDVMIAIKKPAVNLNVRVPHQNAYYYGGEDFYATVDLDDRAGIVDRVNFTIFPLGEPMNVTMTASDKIFTDGCGVLLQLPGKIKPGRYVLQIAAKDGRGTTWMQKNVEFDIRQ
jgi:hypothetical protein